MRPIVAHAAPTHAITPLSTACISAGRPAIADAHEEPIDLHRFLVRDVATTFFIRVEGESMIGAGIQTGDLLVVDRGRQARRDDIVVAHVDGDFTVKRLGLGIDGRAVLWAENPAYGPIIASQQRPVAIWGVVTACIHRF